MSDNSSFKRNSIDLLEILTVIGDRAVNSIWVGQGLECFGEGADELHSYSDNNLKIPGKELLRITSKIYQTIDGDLKAFEKGLTSHWILIRAWDGTGFYFETNDPAIKELFKSRFDIFEDVEAEYRPPSPYVNFFLNFFFCAPVINRLIHRISAFFSKQLTGISFTQSKEYLQDTAILLVY